MRTYLGLLLAFAISACGGTSPTAPMATAAPIVTPAPTPAQLSGHLVATNGGQPIGNAAVSLGSVTATTNNSGDFTSAMPFGTIRVNVTGSGLFPRSLFAAVSGNRALALDAISLNGFDPAFYRQMVRNTFAAPSGSEPLRRWMRTPQIYLKTVDEAGEAIHGPTLDLIEATLRTGVPLWTSQLLGSPTITRGTGSMVGVSGWITVRFPATEATTACGLSQIGADGGSIDLSYHVPPGAAIHCRAPGYVIAPRVVLHELGHALGFWHTDAVSDVMWGGTWTDATQQPSAREIYHAAIAYHRPIGNMEPDTDPASAINALAIVVAR